MSGSPELRQLGAQLLFGDDPAVLQRVACVQSLSGTGALRMCGEFLHEWCDAKATVYVTDPTWSNHIDVFKTCGFAVQKLRWWDAAARGLALAGLMADIEAAPDGSVLVLHTCCHNPTGVDPTPEQWAQLEPLIARKRHVVLFDTAYQGYGSGDPTHDARALRFFVARGHNVLVCQSFAKSLGLYSDRVGTFSVLCARAEQVAAVTSRMSTIARRMYSNPPKHGALIVTTVLGTPELREQWLREMKHMAERIHGMRVALRAELTKLQTPGDWSHITTQIGMFSYLGVTPAQVAHMTGKHHVYLLPSGRISMAGLNAGNVARLAAAMDDAVRNVHASL